MTLGANLYQPRHRSQYDGGLFAKQNCVPTSLATAADQVSHGDIDKSGSQVRALVKVSEETNPLSPGWTMADAKLAASRLGIEITPAISAWTVLETLRSQGRGVLLQGDSEIFDGGCSGAFDGDHCVYLPPLNHSDGRWRLDDPICALWRWEKPATLRAYAGKFAGAGRASYAYTERVAPLPPDTGTGEDFVPGLTITDIVPLPGRVRVKLIEGVLAYQVDDPRAGFGMAPRVEKPTIGKGRVVGDPFGPDTDISRHIVRILGGIDLDGSQVELAVVLADQVDYIPAAVDCSGPIGAENERKRTAMHAAVDEVYG